MGESHAWQLYVAVYVCYALAFIGVALRCYARYFMQNIMGWDDWLMLVSLAIYTSYIGLVLTGLHYGTGRHQQDLKEADFLEGIRFWYLGELIYIVSMTAIKTSIALFYLRILISPWQRLSVKCIMWIVIIFSFTYLCCAVVQCWPVKFTWERFGTNSSLETGSCFPDAVMLSGTYLHCIISAVSDWALALLPIVMIWGVQIPVGLRVIVGMIVLCGIIASTSTLIRIKTVPNIKEKQDFLYNTVPLAVWSTVEPGIAIFAACLATLRPVLRILFPNHIRDVAIHKPPELNIPTNLAGRIESSDDVELGHNAQIQSEKRSRAWTGESSQTINIHFDDRDDDKARRDTQMTFYEETSGNSSRSEGLDKETRISTHTSLGPCQRLPPLVFTSRSLSPRLNSPSSLSPSHVGFCMRESQYIRNSKVIEPTSPL
ncbi:1bdca599-df33-495f-b153-99621d112df9 [Sclerotinia trifoliorum]|uniref:1bdca599-df33-495f-b153-99621d112df9 n=1 Tax=Sclerotinia trifoliorum TaxID=28548 RepID=A0A8H2VV64_9HELO|nr:1bdca599-df33-495f-b153-99621d112df9 [Sclerotinia trifoliorum]